MRAARRVAKSRKGGGEEAKGGSGEGGKGTKLQGSEGKQAIK